MNEEMTMPKNPLEPSLARINQVLSGRMAQMEVENAALVVQVEQLIEYVGEITREKDEVLTALTHAKNELIAIRDIKEAIAAE